VPAPPPPDPARGLFETLLVAAGRPVELDFHLRRLEASAGALFGRGLPASVGGEAEAAARGTELGKLRIQLTPADPGAAREGGATAIPLSHHATVEPVDPAIVFPDHAHGADLRSVAAEGWSGAHKWSDRDWLEATEARFGELVPLLVDAGGVVLEAGRANVFAVVDGALVTPPVDGRILPGTGRAATLALAAELGIEAAERPLALAEIEAAGEAFLTSSVRGVRPARSLDGAPLAGGPTTERIAAELRQRWLGR
jgi:para-aminobenzoate synthetase/4-amino-4-deoxychorismate lyase